MNYRYQPPTDPRPDDDDDSQYDPHAEYEDSDEYGYSRYDDEYDTDRDDSGGTATWLKVVIAVGVFLIVVALVLSSIGPAVFGGGSQQQAQTEYEIAGYVSAIDPSTILVDLDGEETTVKLIGVESVGVADWFDAQVVDAIHEALDGTAVTLEPAGTDTDADGNLLRYVYLSNRAMLNELLIRNGFARVADVAPDNDRYLARMRGAEELARVDGLGFWGLSTQ